MKNKLQKLLSLLLVLAMLTQILICHGGRGCLRREGDGGFRVGDYRGGNCGCSGGICGAGCGRACRRPGGGAL